MASDNNPRDKPPAPRRYYVAGSMRPSAHIQERRPAMASKRLARSERIQRDIRGLYGAIVTVEEIAGEYEFDDKSRIRWLLDRASCDIERARKKLAKLRERAIDDERDRSAE